MTRMASISTLTFSMHMIENTSRKAMQSCAGEQLPWLGGADFMLNRVVYYLLCPRVKLYSSIVLLGKKLILVYMLLPGGEAVGVENRRGRFIPLHQVNPTHTRLKVIGLHLTLLVIITSTYPGFTYQSVMRFSLFAPRIYCHSLMALGIYRIGLLS